MRCLLSLAVLVVLALAAPAAAMSPKNLQKRYCDAETDCVVVLNEGGAKLKMDELNLETSTPTDVIRRLPSWFCKKPAALYHSRRHYRLGEVVPFKEQGVGLAHEVVCKQADDGVSAEL